MVAVVTPTVPDGDDQAANVAPDRELYSASPVAALTSTEKARARKAIAAWFVVSEQHRALIHYTQHRPFDPSILHPENGYKGDCSAYVTQAFYYAQDVIDAPVSDPGSYRYTGYGWTGSILNENHQHVVPHDKYLVGDLALYGGPSLWETRHVVICRVRGTAETAVWSSHGSEAGPLPVKVGYRPDLLTVLRPLSLL